MAEHTKDVWYTAGLIVSIIDNSKNRFKHGGGDQFPDQVEIADTIKKFTKQVTILALLEQWVQYYTSKSTVAARLKLFQDTKTLLKEAKEVKDGR